MKNLSSYEKKKMELPDDSVTAIIQEKEKFLQKYEKLAVMEN
jgi:hypothetical protein